MGKVLQFPSKRQIVKQELTFTCSECETLGEACKTCRFYEWMERQISEAMSFTTITTTDPHDPRIYE